MSRLLDPLLMRIIELLDRNALTVPDITDSSPLPIDSSTTTGKARK